MQQTNKTKQNIRTKPDTKMTKTNISITNTENKQTIKQQMKHKTIIINKQTNTNNQTNKTHNNKEQNKPTPKNKHETDQT